MASETDVGEVPIRSAWLALLQRAPFAACRCGGAARSTQKPPGRRAGGTCSSACLAQGPPLSAQAKRGNLVLARRLIGANSNAVPCSPAKHEGHAALLSDGKYGEQHW
jgi:hypothetical protein